MQSSASIGFAPTFPILNKDVEDKKFQRVSIVNKNHASLVIPLIKELKAEQLIAGMAFRFFGLQNMPVYNADTTFLQDRDFVQLPIKPTQLLAELQKNKDFANNGHIYSNKIAEYKSDLPFDIPNRNVLSFSIKIEEKEIVLVYNASKSEAYEKFIMLNCPPIEEGIFLRTIYGYDTNANIHVCNDVFNKIRMSYIRLYLKPMQLIILKNF